MGNGPGADAYLLLRVGIRVYDHPITPFEELVIRCAASACASIPEAVRSMYRMVASPFDCVKVDHTLDCLQWIEARARRGVWP